MSVGFEYVGGELELFAGARNWKAYWSKRLATWLGDDVLEVGAGIGSNTSLLVRHARGRWTCLEPDPRLLERARRDHAAASETSRVEHRCGTLASLPPELRYDTLLYLDVLEHIEDDRAELELAAARLREGGRVVVLAPAHQALYAPFDRAVGHFRRYDKSALKALAPRGLRLERLEYLDSVGLLASLANRALLRQALPTPGQIRLWDGWMVPLSRAIDPCVARSLGKSIVGVWRR